MRVHQRQADGLGALLHHALTLTALANVKWRGIDHDQQLSPSGFGIIGRRVKPGVFTNQQADLDACVNSQVIATRVKHAGAVARREITPLVKHLVVGQLALGVGVDDLPLTQHQSRVVPLLYCHAFGTQAVARHDRRANHHCQAF